MVNFIVSSQVDYKKCLITRAYWLVLHWFEHCYSVTVEGIVDGVPVDEYLKTKIFSSYIPCFCFNSPASHSCIPELVDGHFLGKSARCVCSLPEGSDPGHTAQWFWTRDDQAVGSGRDITVTYDKDCKCTHTIWIFPARTSSGSFS